MHSCDEMTGISAREQKPSAPSYGSGAREFEYIRQGTSGFMASRDVVTGQVEAPLIQPTRTEVDFAQHVEAVVDLHPDDAHIFVLDNLNTHQSEALVRFVIHHDQLDISPEELGKKGHSGILSSQDTRKQFLETESHSIRFLYTPKHCSGLNQIACGLVSSCARPSINGPVLPQLPRSKGAFANSLNSWPSPSDGRLTANY